MGTPAAVYVEAYDKTVRVNYDGDREYMIPTLQRIVDQGLVEAFASQDEYSGLYRTSEEEDTSGRYLNVESVGAAYPTDDQLKVPSPVVNEAGNRDYASAFSGSGVDYGYVISKDNAVSLVWGE